MTKSKKGAVLVLGVITIILTLSVSNGCNSIDTAYLTRLDTLDQKLNLTYKYLSIDFVTMQNRELRIARELQHVSKYYDQTYTEELGNNLTKYKGIKKVYSNFLNQYPKRFDELKSLEKQVANLRISVNDGDLSKDQFKEYYQTELNDINFNLQFSEKLNRSIHSLEPDYQRISAEVFSLLSDLAGRNVEYRTVFERDSIAQ
jgi:hypothetical protein